ncbi:hypothetical protein L873DRAFT_1797383 [Choiromyces venosus 120613-1]|uniref:Uncharacterized protein n=1 Tax=Choiromyces venosus 120613-1 TaxID=1336337 RepID=A0A3N4KIK1_9PEZI|nr:hypothetical protein L873DRAFT_1797383 [Choiromyces venosus 120613-1]
MAVPSLHGIIVTRSLFKLRFAHSTTPLLCITNGQNYLVNVWEKLLAWCKLGDRQGVARHGPLECPYSSTLSQHKYCTRVLGVGKKSGELLAAKYIINTANSSPDLPFTPGIRYLKKYWHKKGLTKIRWGNITTPLEFSNKEKLGNT